MTGLIVFLSILVLFAIFVVLDPLGARRDKDPEPMEMNPPTPEEIEERRSLYARWIEFLKNARNP